MNFKLNEAIDDILMINGVFIAILKNESVEKSGKKKNTNYDVNKGTYVKT